MALISSGCGQIGGGGGGGGEIRAQIEFYFSDANLPTDEFLLEAVQSDPGGWVSLALVAGFPRVKALVKDQDQQGLGAVAAALQSSGLLELSFDRTKLRRTTPLPPAVLWRKPDDPHLMENDNQSEIERLGREITDTCHTLQFLRRDPNVPVGPLTRCPRAGWSNHSQ